MVNEVAITLIASETGYVCVSGEVRDSNLIWQHVPDLSCSVVSGRKAVRRDMLSQGLFNGALITLAYLLQ